MLYPRKVLVIGEVFVLKIIEWQGNCASHILPNAHRFRNGGVCLWRSWFIEFRSCKFVIITVAWLGESIVKGNYRN